jgi:hypothetical protein
VLWQNQPVIAAFAPSPVRRVARKNNLPVDSITEVRALDPYFYQ